MAAPPPIDCIIIDEITPSGSQQSHIPSVSTNPPNVLAVSYHGQPKVPGTDIPIAYKDLIYITSKAVLEKDPIKGPALLQVILSTCVAQAGLSGDVAEQIKERPEQHPAETNKERGRMEENKPRSQKEDSDPSAPATITSGPSGFPPPTLRTKPPPSDPQLANAAPQPAEHSSRMMSIANAGFQDVDGLPMAFQIKALLRRVEALEEELLAEKQRAKRVRPKSFEELGLASVFRPGEDISAAERDEVGEVGGVIAADTMEYMVGVGDLKSTEDFREKGEKGKEGMERKKGKWRGRRYGVDMDGNRRVNLDDDLARLELMVDILADTSTVSERRLDRQIEDLRDEVMGWMCAFREDVVKEAEGLEVGVEEMATEVARLGKSMDEVVGEVGELREGLEVMREEVGDNFEGIKEEFEGTREDILTMACACGESVEDEVGVALPIPPSAEMVAEAKAKEVGDAKGDVVKDMDRYDESKRKGGDVPASKPLPEVVVTPAEEDRDMEEDVVKNKGKGKVIKPANPASWNNW